MKSLLRKNSFGSSFYPSLQSHFNPLHLARKGIFQGRIYDCSCRECGHDGPVFLAFAQPSIR